MLFAERQYDALIGRRGLQLEIKRGAKAFSEREAPRPIDASAERRMEDQLHAAGLVKKALGNNRVLSRHAAENRAAGRDIHHGLFCASTIQPAFGLQPGNRGRIW